MHLLPMKNVIEFILTLHPIISIRRNLCTKQLLFLEINSIYNPEIINGEGDYAFPFFTLRVMTLWLCPETKAPNGSLTKQQ